MSLSIDQDKLIQRAAVIMQAARYIVTFSGAGISTPSGIPDFRSQHSGLWQKTDPMQTASLSAYRQRPAQFFNWLRPLAKEIWNAAPNPAHCALAELEQRGRLKAILTQNIDGLHQRAGSHQVAELHGSLETFHCPTCRQSYLATDLSDSFIHHEEIPCCPQCKSYLKPDITLFEENLPVHAWGEAEKHSRACDLMLVAGSSLTVYPAAELPVMALENQARLIIINYTSTPLDDAADVVIQADVAEVLDRKSVV